MTRSLGMLAGLVLAVLVLYGVRKTTPGYGEITRPIAVTGRIGEKLSARDFELTVTDVVFVRQVKVEAFGKERSYASSGLWAVVEALAAARDESVTVMAAAWLGPNGVRYAMSERLSGAAGLLPSDRLEPGLPRKVLLVFEFPESQAAGATMLVSRTPFMPLDSELRVEIDTPEPAVRQAARIERAGSGWKMEIE